MIQVRETIDAKARNLRELLQNRRYSLDFYQREYRWGERQISELLEDLTKRFLGNYQPSHSRKDVATYSPYFLGSIVVSERGDVRFLIDGQQRLTSLTLLLIHLHHSLDAGEAAQIAPLVSSVHYGEHSFNMDVPERNKCMAALFEREPYDASRQSESVANILARFQEIEDWWSSDDLPLDVLPFFADWLIEKLTLVEIVTTDDDMAYEIFETMNDRGLSLTPTEMLKGYLLSNVGSVDEVANSEAIWRDQIQRLDVDKSADADFFKAWLRASYAGTIRDRKRDAIPQDYDLVGTQFHRWVRDNSERIGLVSKADYRRFVAHDFVRMSRHYETIIRASAQLVPGLEDVLYDSRLGVPQLPTMLLAPITPDDSDALAVRKMRIVSAFLDIYFMRRVANSRNYGYSPMYYRLFIIAKEIRGQEPVALVESLLQQLELQTNEGDLITGVDAYSLHGRNAHQVRCLLARLTEFVERESGIEALGFASYSTSRFEIEHVVANRFDRHPEYGSEDEFQRVRNRLGALVLLPKGINASFQDKPYVEKVEHYTGQNLLARSLHRLCYQNNPGFLGFVHRKGLPFTAVKTFDREAIEGRQVLYGQLCEMIWDPARLQAILEEH
ncbi:MAG: DUF262 domain-containing HNH endonuclease family protein [Actinomycetota bacterium]|nr:DUF262 domain-containing HNH endonuclease family protein [Actinomycetota bacterium]